MTTEWQLLYCETGRRMASHYASLMENEVVPFLDPDRTGPMPPTGSQLRAIDVLKREIQNFQKASEAGFYTESWEQVIRLARRPVRVYVHTHWPGWEWMCELACEAARRLGNEAAEAEALYNLGAVCSVSKRWEDAARYHETSRLLYKKLGDSCGQVHNTIAEANALCSQRQYVHALKRLQECAIQAAKLDDKTLHSAAVHNIGVIFQDLSMFAEARRCYRAAARISREGGLRINEAIALRELGRATSGWTHRDDAVACFTAALRIFDEENDVVGRLAILLELSGLFSTLSTLRSTDRATAHSYAKRAFNLAQELGDRSSEAKAIMELASLELHRRQYATAAEGFTRSARLFEDQGNSQDLAACLANLALAYSKLSRVDDAIQVTEKALRITREMIQGAVIVPQAKLLFFLTTFNLRLGRIRIAWRRGVEFVRQLRSDLIPVIEFAMHQRAARAAIRAAAAPMTPAEETGRG